MKNDGIGQARLLEVTRLVSRAGDRLTGVDRVEYAYLDYFVKDSSVPCFAILRTAVGYLLLDRAGMANLRDRVRDNRWGRPDLLSRFRRKYTENRAAAESDVRRVALARCRSTRLPKMLGRHLPKGTHYFNVGLTTATRRFLDALRTIQPTIATMLHDTIPLDWPQFCDERNGKRFADFFDRMIDYSDVILCNSKVTEDDVLRCAAPRTPRTVTGHLGIDVPVHDVKPAPPPGENPYFVILSTIEIRKNHRLLLDIWDRIPDADLVIIGRRGWMSEDVFARLDQKPPRVFEYNNLGDAEVFSLVKGSAGMLFPSFTEGYGLPPLEAAAMGVPVICNDLPIFREVLGDYPVYANVNDSYLWIEAIRKLAQDHKAGVATQPPMVPPTWDDHFKAVLTHL